MDGLMAALWIRRIYFAGKNKKKHFQKIELAKKIVFCKTNKIFKAIATLLEEILEGNFFHFGNKEAKQQQQRIDLN
jgi:uncharacterized pyridoxamine 5'-phosphate oxidase family protein